MTGRYKSLLDALPPGSVPAHWCSQSSTGHQTTGGYLAQSKHIEKSPFLSFYSFYQIV